MRAVAIVGAAALVVAAAIAASIIFLRDTGGQTRSVEVEPVPSATPPRELPTPLPATWMAGLRRSSEGDAYLLSCLDTNDDDVLSGDDHDLFAGLEIPLDAAKVCAEPDTSRDFFVGQPDDTVAYSCDAPRPPVLFVAVGSAGSDLLDPSSGESLGVLDLANLLQDRTADAGIASRVVLTTAAIFGADPPQVHMERFLTAELARQLDVLPCLRAVIVGHSHGGATVTAVTAALDGDYNQRLFGVLIDRSTVLYDRNETEFPLRTKILNVFQLNEGWHGEPLSLANVYNVDQSYERAPIALSDGGGGFALVSHKTLDDAPGVQRLIADAVMTWLTTP
jgi:hypothetical protein